MQTESIFRIASKQAIKEIIEEYGASGRFGLILTDENLESISDRVVDLFEMTIELRKHTRAMMGEGITGEKNTATNQKKQRDFLTDDVEPFARSKNSSEIYSYGEKQKKGSMDFGALPTNIHMGLPKKKISMNADERQRFNSR